MDLEEIELPNLWIPVRLLRDAAEVRPNFSLSHRKAASSPPLTPSTNFAKSFNKASFACTSINQHSRYNTASLETLNQIQSEFESLRDKKMCLLIKRLNEEISILSQQLSQSNLIICNLNNKINDLTKRHVVHLQALQERHEQKMKKNKQDFEFFLKEILKNQRFDEYEASKVMKNELENSCIEFQRQVVWMKGFCVNLVSDLKEKFDEELEEVRRKYKEKIRKMKEGSRGVLRNDSTAVQVEEEVEEERSGRIDRVEGLNGL